MSSNSGHIDPNKIHTLFATLYGPSIPGRETSLGMLLCDTKYAFAELVATLLSCQGSSRDNAKAREMRGIPKLDEKTIQGLQTTQKNLSGLSQALHAININVLRPLDAGETATTLIEAYNAFDLYPHLTTGMQTNVIAAAMGVLGLETPETMRTRAAQACIRKPDEPTIPR